MDLCAITVVEFRAGRPVAARAQPDRAPRRRSHERGRRRPSRRRAERGRAVARRAGSPSAAQRRRRSLRRKASRSSETRSRRWAARRLGDPLVAEDLAGVDRPRPWPGDGLELRSDVGQDLAERPGVLVHGLGRTWPEAETRRDAGDRCHTRRRRVVGPRGPRRQARNATTGHDEQQQHADRQQRPEVAAARRPDEPARIPGRAHVRRSRSSRRGPALAEGRGGRAGERADRTAAARPATTAAAGRVERDPAVAREVHLDPGVGVAVRDRLDPGALIERRRAESPRRCGPGCRGRAGSPPWSRRSTGRSRACSVGEALDGDESSRSPDHARRCRT